MLDLTALKRVEETSIWISLRGLFFWWGDDGVRRKEVISTLGSKMSMGGMGWEFMRTRMVLRMGCPRRRYIELW